MRLLLPKALSEQARWKDAIDNTMVTPVFCHPIEVERLEESGAMKTIWMNLDIYQGIICVSPTAAQALVDALDRYWPMPPMDIRWLCNGPRTASVLQDQGLQATYPETGNTAEDVLALAQARVESNEHWLIVKGEGGRQAYEHELQARGAQVSIIETYRRYTSDKELDAMQAQAEQCDAIWLSSTHLGQHLMDASPEFWRQWSGQWWVSSARLAQWAAEQKLGNIKLANGATPTGLLQLIAEVSREQS